MRWTELFDSFILMILLLIFYIVFKYAYGTISLYILPVYFKQKLRSVPITKQCIKCSPFFNHSFCSQKETCVSFSQNNSCKNLSVIVTQYSYSSYCYLILLSHLYMKMKNKESLYLQYIFWFAKIKELNNKKVKLI